MAHHNTASHHFSTWDFGKSHFSTDVSSWEHFGTCTVRPADVPADGRFNTGRFQHGDFSAWGIFSMRNFWHHGHFSTGYFGTWTFRHIDFLAPCKAIWTFWHRHFSTCATVPKGPCAKMSPCRNVHDAEKSLCWKVPVLKSPCTETSTETKCPCARTPTGPKRASAEMSWWWNVCAEMSLAEMLGAEMVGSPYWWLEMSS